MLMNGKSLLAATIVSLSFFLGQAWAEAGNSARYSAIARIEIADQSTTDGSNLLDRVVGKAQTLNDYTYDCRLVSFKHPKPKETGARFFFKKPNLVRLEVVSDDYRNGSIVTRCANGTIKGCGGGLLNAMKMTLADDSRLLKLPSGQNAVKSDFLSLLTDTKSVIAGGALCKATKTPVSVQSLDGSKLAFVLEVYGKSAAGSQLSLRMLIDPQTLMPMEWGCFKDGSLVSTTVFRNLNANKGIDDSLFQL